MKLSTSCLKKKTQFIRHGSFENLAVLPYVRGRLVFAELAARAIEEGLFDIVAIDLPYFMNNNSWLDAPLRAFPHVSSLMVRQKDMSFINLSFMPNDAACASSTAVKIVQATGSDISLECIDDSNIIHYSEYCNDGAPPDMRDDYFVFTDGLEEYFSPVFKEFDLSWNLLSDDRRFFQKHRAGLINDRLINILLKGKRTLFVCEYRLWHAVSRAIKGATPTEKYFFPRWEKVTAALVMYDSSLYWAEGMLDDYPAVVHAFYKSLQLGTTKSFDKLETLDMIVNSSLMSSKAGNASVRGMLSHTAYAMKRQAALLQYTLPLVTHLYADVRSCFSKKMAAEIARELLEYPNPDFSEIASYYVINADDIEYIGEKDFTVPDFSGAGYIYAGKSAFYHGIMTDVFGSSQERLEFACKMQNRMTRSESRQMEDVAYGTSWAVENDYRLHEIACSHVRGLIEKKGYAKSGIKSFGPHGEGIDWKATLASAAKGENSLYVKQRRRSAERYSGRLDEYTPTVFLFENDLKSHITDTIADYNATKRYAALNTPDFDFRSAPPPDLVYSVFYTYAESTRTCGGHIIRKKLGSIAFLYTKFLMGLERYEKLTARPGRFQCRVSPMDDSELSNFPLEEKGIAWAVKYSMQTTLVVARNGWKPSARLNDFAGKKKIRIMSIPISGFSDDFIERLKTIYLLSTPLKKHSEREKILRRFIE